ncbi:CBS domain-containing protein [Terribacillus halophilus]|uniref:CBS domain-containing protein n=1 Tax=Terribacillus halophilus TaxID=361279 RepID=A0A1G6NP52_9BACI|nr:cyclic-di-AMP-binding protein CbpB [Terribacillus halophilus]SDC68935.1 CBS domain-containing protein [Terribacillus halophilus]
MAKLELQELTGITVEDLMIESEKVAHVQLNNPLEHALLVLVKSGYSVIPVLDHMYRLKGMISKTAILNEVLGMERFEMEKLSELKVSGTMLTDVPVLKKSDTFLTALKAVVNQAFLCVLDDEGYFEGILTRRAILKKMNRYLHEQVHYHPTADKTNV